jgi:hypothetical protein
LTTSEINTLNNDTTYKAPLYTFANKIGSTTNVGSLYVSDFRILTTNNVNSPALYNGIYINNNLLHYEFKTTDTLTFTTSQPYELYALTTNSSMTTPIIWYQFENNVDNSSNVVTLYDIGVVYDCNVMGTKYNMDIVHFFEDTINLYFWYRFDNSSEFVRNYGLTGTTYNLNTFNSTITPVANVSSKIDTNDFMVGSASFNFTTNYTAKSSVTYNYATNFTNAISIAFWAKIVNLNTTNGGWDCILNALGTIQRNAAGSTWNISIFGATYTSSTATFQYVADNIWNHYVFIVEKGGTGGTQAKLTIYKNAILESSGTFAGT